MYKTPNAVAVVNPILWAGAKVMYVDIDETLNINVGDLEKKIKNFKPCFLFSEKFIKYISHFN